MRLKSWKIFESDKDITEDSKSNESITDEINQSVYNHFISDLEDISLDIKDSGFYVSIIKQLGKRIDVQITKKNNFHMIDELKDFLTRSVFYMEDYGWDCEIQSNHGRLYIYDDGKRIITSGGNLNKNWPTFTIIKLSFFK